MNKRRYLYDGPVFEFDKCIAQKWTAATYAVSEKKARSNMTHQFKKETGRAIYSKITLTGEIIDLDSRN
jgi:hypothetical protein